MVRAHCLVIGWRSAAAVLGCVWKPQASTPSTSPWRSTSTRIEVMVANPHATASFAEAMMKRSRTDAVDAETLLAFVERMELTAWRPSAREVMAERSESSTLPEDGATPLRQLLPIWGGVSPRWECSHYGWLVQAVFLMFGLNPSEWGGVVLI